MEIKNSLIFGPKTRVGFVIDVHDQLKLDKLKPVVVEFVKTLSAEDTVYVYRPESLELRRRQGEQVAEIANYRTPKFEAATAISETVAALSVTDRDDRKTVIYAFDRPNETTHRRIERGFRSDLIYDTGMSFWILDLSGKQNNKIEGITKSHPKCQYLPVPITHFNSQLLKEIIANV